MLTPVLTRLYLATLCLSSILIAFPEPFDMESRLPEEIREVIEDKKDHDENGFEVAKTEDGEILS